MLVKTDFLNKIKDFGLNTYEAKLWTALLSRGISTAGELSDIANVPRSRTYDVLESLEKKGFIIMKIGKPIKYIAVPPEEVIERVKKKINEDAERQANIISELKNSSILQELNLLHANGIDLVEPVQFSGAIKGRNNVYNHIDSMIKNAEKSIVLMSSEEGLIRKYNSFSSSLQKAKEKGVKIKIISPITKSSLKKVPKLENFAELKSHDKIKGRFLVVDNKELIFMVLDDATVHQSYDLAIWIKSSFFAETLGNMFAETWDNTNNI